jgi:hypothetical protein
VTRLELAILHAVVYAGLFDYPLTIEEVRRTLVESAGTAADVVAAYSRSRVLGEVVEYRDGFFFPAGRGDLIAERRRRETRSRAFLERHRRVIATICRMPFVRMAALSGSIAHLNLEEGGDLDLFIVTRGHHVWTVTLAILVLTRLLGCRREICANFVVSDSQLAFEQQDLFTANQIVHLKPLVGAEVMAELLAANPFVVRFYPNAVADVSSKLDARTGPAGAELAPPDQRRSSIVERLARSAYGWYLRRKARSWRSPEQVRLGADCLKLHTRSHRRSITDRFDAAVSLAIERAHPPALAAGGRRWKR